MEAVTKELTIDIRPATQDDFEDIARLLIQLYDAEIPGALRGPLPAQRQLLRFTLQAKDAQGLRGRYVATASDGTVVASGVMERPGTVPYERAPSGTIGLAMKLIGLRATMRLLRTVAQTMIGVQRPAVPGGVLVHSLVVDRAYRGQGIGRALMAAMEQQASAEGFTATWLQVLTMNQAAGHMYRSMGYEEIWSSPRWVNLLTWSSSIMRKSLPIDGKETLVAPVG